MSSILISGFEPFHSYGLNSSQEVLRELEVLVQSSRLQVATCCLPVVRQLSAQVLLEEIERVKPRAVIALGQSNRSCISIERIAINIDDYGASENIGHRAVDRPVVEGAPAAYWSSLPVRKLQQVLTAAGVMSTLSSSAGTFVCNHLFYQLQHALSDVDVLSGFVHLPMLPVQVVDEYQQTMSLELQVKAILLVVNVIEEHLQESCVSN